MLFLLLTLFFSPCFAGESSANTKELLAKMFQSHKEAAKNLGLESENVTPFDRMTTISKLASEFFGNDDYVTLRAKNPAAFDQAYLAACQGDRESLEALSANYASFMSVYKKSDRSALIRLTLLQQEGSLINNSNAIALLQEKMYQHETIVRQNPGSYKRGIKDIAKSFFQEDYEPLSKDDLALRYTQALSGDLPSLRRLIKSYSNFTQASELSPTNPQESAVRLEALKDLESKLVRKAVISSQQKHGELFYVHRKLSQLVDKNDLKNVYSDACKHFFGHDFALFYLQDGTNVLESFYASACNGNISALEKLISLYATPCEHVDFCEYSHQARLDTLQEYVKKSKNIFRKENPNKESRKVLGELSLKSDTSDFKKPAPKKINLPKSETHVASQEHVNNSTSLQSTVLEEITNEALSGLSLTHEKPDIEMPNPKRLKESKGKAHALIQD